MIRKLVFIWLVVCSAAVLPIGVRAHANLVESLPAANSVVAEPPATAQLRFTEPLEASYSRVVLASAEGGTVETEPSRVAPYDPYTLLLDLPPLAEGVYTLHWRTLSTVDGHTMQGIVAFAVGDPAAANAPLVLPPPPPDPLATPRLIEVALRWLSVVSLAVTAGTLVFRLVLWGPESATNLSLFEHVRKHLRRLTIGAAAVALVASIGVVVLASATAETTVPATISGSRIGMILAIRTALIGALLALLSATAPSRDDFALILGLGALLTLSLLSHSAVPQAVASGQNDAVRTALAVAFDFIHLSTTSAWLGALPALLYAVVALQRLQPERRGWAATSLVAGFTGLATASVIALAATGTFAAFQHITDVRDLWTTTYGRALVIKLALFGFLLLLGAYNRWFIQPQLGELAGTATANLRRLRISVGAEIGLGVVLVGAAAVLTASAPPAGTKQRSGNYADTVAVGRVALSLQVVRGELAGDIFAVTSRGLPPGVQPEVVVRASMPAHGTGAQELKLQMVEPGRWGVRAALLTMPGEWNVEAIVRAPGMDDVRHTFVVDTIPRTSERMGTAAQPVWPILLVAAALVVALSQLPIRRVWQYRFQLGSVGILLVAFLAAIGPYYLTRATVQTNPLSATPEVLAAGRVVYEHNCASCHGTRGRGDGPTAQSLPGLPADFTSAHFATHRDAELYGWIRGGKPGTAMPAFGDSLSEEQIWQTVTYIRQLYAEAQPR